MKSLKIKTSNFTAAVLAVVKSIPPGQVLSYSDVAQKAGFPRSARAVGSLMKRNFDHSIPCHRVIKKNGQPGEYNRGGPDRKQALLRKEGYLPTMTTESTIGLTKV